MWFIYKYSGSGYNNCDENNLKVIDRPAGLLFRDPNSWEVVGIYDSENEADLARYRMHRLATISKTCLKFNGAKP